MKKGFTLIELLAVIAIIGVVALIVFPTIMSTIERSKQNLYEIQIRDIEEAAKKWATDHMEFMDSTHLNEIGVSLHSIIASEYLQKSNVQDPRDEVIMNGCVKITYDNSIDQYHFQYIESSCEYTIVSGYIYTYNNPNWEKTEQNPIISASDAIIENYASNLLIKTEGQTTDGFYDEGERYVFRGIHVNNYVKLNGGNEVYRILSIEKSTGKMRLMGMTAIPNAWDSENQTVFENASISSVQLQNYYSNSTNGLTENESKIEQDAIWNVGAVTSDGSYTVLKSLEAGRTAYGKIGLPSISDYVGASTSLACHEAILSDSCKEQNYLYELWKGKNTWTINIEEDKIWYVRADGILSKVEPSAIYYIYPVVELKANTYITSGDGQSVSPYIFQ